VAYVSGYSFYPDNPEYNTMRLNFTYADNDQIVTAIERLSKVVGQEAMMAK